GARKTKVVLAGQGVGPYRSCAYHSQLRWLTPGKSVTRAGPSRVRSVSRRLRSIGAPARHTTNTALCVCAAHRATSGARAQCVFPCSGSRNVKEEGMFFQVRHVRQWIAVAAALAFVPVWAQAQDRSVTITGRVIGENGDALRAANVAIPELSLVVYVDADGNYRLV